MFDFLKRAKKSKKQIWVNDVYMTSGNPEEYKGYVKKFENEDYVSLYSPEYLKKRGD